MSLVLTRRSHESVVIKVPPSSEEREIVIEVAQIRGSQVRLRFSAPPDVKIERSDWKPKTDPGVLQYQRQVRELLDRRTAGLLSQDDEAEMAESLDDIWRTLSQDQQREIEISFKSRRWNQP